MSGGLFGSSSVKQDSRIPEGQGRSTASHASFCGGGDGSGCVKADIRIPLHGMLISIPYLAVHLHLSSLFRPSCPFGKVFCPSGQSFDRSGFARWGRASELQVRARVRALSLFSSEKQANRACPGGQNESVIKDSAQDDRFPEGQGRMAKSHTSLCGDEDGSACIKADILIPLHGKLMSSCCLAVSLHLSALFRQSCPFGKAFCPSGQSFDRSGFAQWGRAPELQVRARVRALSLFSSEKQANRACPGGQNESVIKDSAQGSRFPKGQGRATASQASFCRGGMDPAAFNVSRETLEYPLP